MFNLAIDSKLRGSDLVNLRVRDVTHGNQILARTMVVQRKTQRPVQFELTEPTRTAVATWIDKANLKPEQHLFPSRLAKYLLDSGNGQADPHALTLTQDELAAAVGSTRVTVNKVLADFEHRGLIRVARRHVDVLAPDRLRKEIHG